MTDRKRFVKIQGILIKNVRYNGLEDLQKIDRATAEINEMFKQYEKNKKKKGD